MTSSKEVFEWDDTKARDNEAKHGIPFPLAARACLDPRAIFVPDPCQTEERWRVIGHAGGGIILLVVTTDREHRTRIISARLATAPEASLYLDP
jgi:uncharacterized DUF497 family protein